MRGRFVERSIQARVLEVQGKCEEALDVIEDALANIPEGVYDGRAIPVEVHLAKLKELYAVTCRRLEKPREALEMLSRPNVTTSTPAHLIAGAVSPNFNALFERGHAFELLENYAAAWDCFLGANLTQALPFDPEELERRIKGPQKAPSTNTSTRSGSNLIFIVGIPRSGTSLLEQILGRHSKVTPMGERGDFIEFSHDLSGRGWPDIEVSQLDRLADSYLSRCPEGEIFTDKMPGNWYQLKLIKQVFPDAKVIHCVRDPQDCLLSCFKQRFSQNGLSWAASPEGIIQYYRLWEEVGVDEFEVQYETLVENPEGEIRRILSFLEIPFEESCLSPEASDRFVATASYAQVKKPIHTKSIGVGHNYKKWLPIKKTS